MYKEEATSAYFKTIIDHLLQIPMCTEKQSEKINDSG